MLSRQLAGAARAKDHREMAYCPIGAAPLRLRLCPGQFGGRQAPARGRKDEGPEMSAPPLPEESAPLHGPAPEGPGFGDVRP